jgi:hypothetical protein
MSGKLLTHEYEFNVHLANWQILEYECNVYIYEW